MSNVSEKVLLTVVIMTGVVMVICTFIVQRAGVERARITSEADEAMVRLAAHGASIAVDMRRSTENVNHTTTPNVSTD